MRKITSRNQGGKNRHETLNTGFVKPPLLEVFRAWLGKSRATSWCWCEKRLEQRSPEVPFNLNHWGISQNHKIRAAHKIYTLPYCCAAMISYMELQRQHMYLCERLQESIFWVKNKGIWWVNLKWEVTGFNQAESLFNKPSFSKILKVFYDLD